MTKQIADWLAEHLAPKGVGVVLRAEHLCMTLRGAQVSGTTTSEGDNVSITAGRKRYVLPAKDVTILPLVNTATEAIAEYLLERVLPFLHGYGLTTVELELSEAPDTSATARFDFT